MSAGTATTTWPPDARSTTLFHRQQEGVAETISGAFDIQRRPDGSYVAWLIISRDPVRLVIPAGESFDDAMRRIEAALAQASYPSDDMSTAHTPAPAAARPPSA